LIKKKNFWIMFLFYLANLIVVLLAIAFWVDNTFVKILLAVYLMFISGLFSYSNRKKKK